VLLAQTQNIESTTLSRLDTERDDSFRVRSLHGEFVLKIAHPDDDPLYTNLQTMALAYASELEPRLPLQRFVQSLGGEVEPEVSAGNNAGRVARLLTWLPGVPLFETTPGPAQLALLGETLGQLNAALSTFDHPAAHRGFVWDAAQLPLCNDLRELAPWPEIDDTFDLFAHHVAPVLASLPHQVIHNDFHPGNVLVDAEGVTFITGVLDFGDTVYTARVVDLAVALSYLRAPLRVDDTTPFVDGFERVVPLTDDERGVLLPLIAARFAQRILVNLALARGNPQERDDAFGGADANRAALAAVLKEI
jgi:hydroxylysine kinase